MSFYVYMSEYVLRMLEKCFSPEERARCKQLVDRIVRYQGNAGVFAKHLQGVNEKESYIASRQAMPNLGYRDETITLFEGDDERRDRCIIYVSYYKGPPRGVHKQQSCDRIVQAQLRHDDITIHDAQPIREKPRAKSKKRQR